MADEESKMRLLDSDEEEEEEEINLNIRPQYEGPRGQQIFEMNLELSKRFKLDERFAEDFESEDEEKAASENISEENEEKKKNMRILQTVLGHEVKKSTDKNFSKKRLIRFDPEDENASKFVKTIETTSEKPKKSKKKKEIVNKIEDPVPISTERYIDVCSNLKEVLNTSTPFSFSQQFNFEPEEVTENHQSEKIPTVTEEIEILDVQRKEENNLVVPMEESCLKSFTPKSKCDPFFIVEGDPRLKEGIAFFKIPKPLEEIRVEWQKRRENVLELFKRKRKSSQRSYSTKVRSVQIKNNIRKNNFKK